jgi:hypothetical protein
MKPLESTSIWKTKKKELEPIGSQDSVFSKNGNYPILWTSIFPTN